MLNIIKNTINRVFASGVDSDASAFITATGLSGTTQKSAITTLVKDLKSSGLWSKMKAVYPMVTDQRNLLSYTEDFSNALWIKRANTTITANQETAPNGTLTADRVVFSAANTDVHYDIVISNVTWSAYIKGTAGETVNFGFGAGSAIIHTLTGGWDRVSLFSSSTSNVYIGNWVGATASTIYVWGAQLESGNQLSTYQPILTTPSAFMASQMKYNLKDARDLDVAFRLTWSGGWTYSATGATPNGTNAYADTKLIANANLSQNSTHLSSYIRNTSQGVLLGSDNAFRLWIAPNFNGINKYVEINSGSTTAPSATISSAIGLWVGNRIINTQSRLYNNNSLNYTATSTSAGLDTINIFLSARNTGVASNYSSSQVAFASIGDGLSEQETLLLNQITEKYQVALSRGVQAAQSFYYNSAYSNEANTYLYSTQITGTTQVSAINTLINGLKANNLWTKMKAVYPFVTDKINLLSYTEDFTNAVWTNNNLTISANSTNSPINTLTADTLTPTTSNVLHFVQSAIVYSAGNQVLSVYAKSNGYNFVAIGENNGTAWAYFNLSNGTVGNTNNAVSTSIENVGNGWYRCSLTYASSGGTKGAFILCDSVNGNLSAFAGNGTNGIYLWGAQLELGSTASTYQPVLAANNYATNVAAQMKFNLVNPQDSDAAFRLAFSGGWTYSTNGAQPNGTNGFADTFLIPNTSLSTSSSHLSFYSRTNSPSGGYTGYEVARTHYALITQFSGNTFYANLETVGSYAASYTSTNGLGHFIASRINNTTTQGFKNGLKVINASQNSSLATSSLIISNNGGANYSNKQTAFVSIGDGFTDAEAALFYQLIQEFQTTLSRNV